jgi:hypothetical protein
MFKSLEADNMKKAAIFFIIGMFFLGTAVAEVRWFKGNSHCHTTNSDGDLPPRQVVRWYHDHGYNFIVITDHNLLTDPLYLDTDDRDDFLLIPGEEVTDGFEKRPLHVCAINIDEAIPPRTGDSVVSTLQNNVDAVIRQGGLAQLNHPNWRWAFTDKEIAQVRGAKLLEVYNFSFNCNNFGAGGKDGMEEIWDRVLSRGILMYGIASDDAHDYTGEFSPLKSNPGTGWIMVKAEALTIKDITVALESGSFYSTNGVELKDVQISETEYRVDISADSQTRYTTTFIGRDGHVLKEVFGPSAVYAFQGDEMYVRARIFASSGQFACTQPVFLKNQIR